MKTIQFLVAAFALAAMPVASYGASKCDDCATCCKAKEKTCTKDCCAKK